MYGKTRLREMDLIENYRGHLGNGCNL